MKYIIDVSDEAIELMGGHISIFVEPVFKTGDCKRYALRLSKEDIEPYTEPDEDEIRQKAHEEAWEFAKTVSIMKPEDKRECWGTDKYNTINLGYSYQEAKTQYDAWKKQKDGIRVGDEVVYADDPNKEKAIVLRLYQPKQYKMLADILCEDGTVIKMIKVENLVWTGRHFDEVEDLLKKMKEE